MNDFIIVGASTVLCAIFYFIGRLSVESRVIRLKEELYLAAQENERMADRLRRASADLSRLTDRDAKGRFVGGKK